MSSARRSWCAVACAIAAVALALPARAQEREACMMCHAEPDVVGRRVVSTGVLDRSVHKDLDCTGCHQDLAGSETGHDEVKVAPVACASCHDDEQKQFEASIHGHAAARGDRLAPRCTDCHGRHDIEHAADPKARTANINVPLLCGKCHHEGSPVSLTHDIPQDRILENYSESIHGEGLYKKGLTVTAVCTSCHTAHRVLPHTDTNSSVNRQNIAATCTRCHSRIEQVHRKVIEGRLWETEPHKIPSCSECHSPHKIRVAAYPQGMANKDCLLCHGKPDLHVLRAGRSVSLYVDEQEHASSAHGRVACAQCHTGVQTSRVRPCETITGRVDCSVCHAEVVQTYDASIHGQLAAKDDPDAPRCLDCHAHHGTKSKRSPASPTFSRNVPELCARCHREGEKAARRIEGPGRTSVKSYQSSIHGVGLLESGLVVTANCADCHTAHGELPASDPRSTVHRSRIVDTCSRCHQGIGVVFKASIHSPDVARRDKDKLPTCEDCHTSHSISRTDTGDFRFQMMGQCGRCHEVEAETFFETYHGKSSKLGRAGAAKCYDCHGTHDILPTVDQHSRLSRDNVVATCGKCHPGSNRRFAGYLTHATHHDRKKYPYLFFAFWGMTALLAGTLSFASVHTGAWLWRLWRTREHWREHKAEAAAAARLYERFTAKQRAMHLVMLLSFFTLALTGMALKFSYTAWAAIVSSILGGSESMGLLHRFAAVALIALFATHLWDVRRQKRAAGLSWPKFIFHPDSLMFGWQDARQVWQSVRWFFGRGERPKYGRYTYWEKFDYFAVFWGVLVIGSTGLVLWFPELFTRLLPGWSINVATIIHSDEALLAVAFIFTVHFFNTHFRPDKFPMDPVIFTGRVPLEELKYDKPAEYEALVASGKLEQRLVAPAPRRFETAARVFGFAALAIGLTLIALILYTMLFGYR
ncbi:MAG: hypothetical protein KBD01_17490 [Acidobacteria bacterium]|nr:hypothetical protein [Acidobacteriota bacterium]